MTDLQPELELGLEGPRGGETFDPARDESRLNRQARDVFRIVADEEWHTLAELAERTGHPEASVSARLRDLRKVRFGAHIVERMYLGDGLHAYRCLLRREGHCDE